MKSFKIRNYNSIPCVDSLSLFRALDYVPRNYYAWAKNLWKLGDEDVDYFKQKSMLFDAPEVMIRRRYHVTLTFACELCAASRTENGRQLKYEFRRILESSSKK